MPPREQKVFSHGSDLLAPRFRRYHVVQKTPTEHRMGLRHLKRDGTAFISPNRMTLTPFSEDVISRLQTKGLDSLLTTYCLINTSNLCMLQQQQQQQQCCQQICESRLRYESLGLANSRFSLFGKLQWRNKQPTHTHTYK